MLHYILATLLFAIGEFQLSTMKENEAAGITLAKTRGVYKGGKKGTTTIKPDRPERPRQTALTGSLNKANIHL